MDKQISVDFFADGAFWDDRHSEENGRKSSIRSTLGLCSTQSCD